MNKCIISNHSLWACRHVIKIFNIVLQHLSSFTLRTPQETQVPAQERLKQTKVQYIFLTSTVNSLIATTSHM